MYRFKCWDCGKYFDDPKYVKEYRGEFWGSPAYESMAYCPYCDGDFDEAHIVEKAEAEEQEEE